MIKKGDFENQKEVPKCDFSTKSANQSPISAVFQIVRFAGDQKTELTGESLINKSTRTDCL